MKLYNDDCLEVMKTIEDNSIDLIVTDPPYEMTKNGKSSRPNYMKANSTGNLFDAELVDTNSWISECFRVLKHDSHFYVWTNKNSIVEYLNIAINNGFKLHNIISMIKDTLNPNRWYLKQTELILFFYKGKAKAINDLTSKDWFKVEMPTLSTNKLHITQKPLDLVTKLVTNSSDENDIVLDPFMGSGTTGVACTHTNRKFIGIEINKDYFTKAKERIESCYNNLDEVFK